MSRIIYKTENFKYTIEDVLNIIELETTKTKININLISKNYKKNKFDIKSLKEYENRLNILNASLLICENINMVDLNDFDNIDEVDTMDKYFICSLIREFEDEHGRKND